MRRLQFKLFFQDIFPARSSDEPKKGWRRVQRSCAEFRVCLETKEIRMIYVTMFFEILTMEQVTDRIDSRSNSSICIRSPFSSLPTKLNPSTASSSTRAGFTSYRCRWRSQIMGAPAYSLRAVVCSVPGSKTDGRSPRRIVPPIWVLEISGINTITGFSTFGTNSSEVASVTSTKK